MPTWAIVLLSVLGVILVVWVLQAADRSRNRRQDLLESVDEEGFFVVLVDCIIDLVSLVFGRHD